jgi:hypothetical protein
MPSLREQHGAVTLAATLVVFFALLALAVSLQFVGIGDLQGAFQDTQSERAFQAADSCLSEALLRLERDSAYAGGSLSVGTASCTISVSGAGASRTVAVTATAARAVRKLDVDIALTAGEATIADWNEEIN